MRALLRSFPAALALSFLAACGGGDQGGQQMADNNGAGAAASAMAASGMPDWMTVDSAAKTVHLAIEAGKTPDNNHWNYNGHTNGDITITVPQGYAVTIAFKNDDPAMAHSLAIVPHEGPMLPATFANVEPVFAGARTSNSMDPAQATQPGRSETITFTADQAGSYAMACEIPGHAVAGMWVGFTVSSDGTTGVSGT